jgi:O-methyltransferase
MKHALARIEEMNHALFEDIFDNIRHATMVPKLSCFATWAMAIHLITEKKQGDFAEFGTWQGGCSFGLALMQRELFGSVLKPVWMFDSFEGLPKAEKRDGIGALRYQANTSSPEYYDNCSAPIEQVMALRNALQLSEVETPIVKGWFEETLPLHRSVLGVNRLAMARIDCDWYKPVKFVLDNVDPLVVENGAVIIDDYFSWDGCTRATHDFFAEKSHIYRLREIGDGMAAFYMKSTPQ